MKIPIIQAAGQARTKMGFAVHHLLAAARFARQCHKVETDHQGEQINYFFDEIISCCSAAIFLSVASLEAHINELFSDPAVNFASRSEHLVNETFQKIDNGPILEKYQEALNLLSANIFRKGHDKEYQHARVLINLRNTLTHFKPEWESQQANHKKVSDGLRGKFHPSPFLSKDEPLFPKGFMSHDCCKWAIKTALVFIASFSERAKLPNRFELWESSLLTE